MRLPVTANSYLIKLKTAFKEHYLLRDPWVLVAVFIFLEHPAETLLELIWRWVPNISFL